MRRRTRTAILTYDFQFNNGRRRWVIIANSWCFENGANFLETRKGVMGFSQFQQKWAGFGIPFTEGFSIVAGSIYYCFIWHTSCSSLC